MHTPMKNAQISRFRCVMNIPSFCCLDYLVVMLGIRCTVKIVGQSGENALLIETAKNLCKITYIWLSDIFLIQIYIIQISQIMQ